MRTNCPNCAASIDLKVDNCPYCGTPYRLLGIEPEPISLELQAAIAAPLLTPNELRELMGLSQIRRDIV